MNNWQSTNHILRSVLRNDGGSGTKWWNRNASSLAEIKIWLSPETQEDAASSLSGAIRAWLRVQLLHRRSLPTLPALQVDAQQAVWTPDPHPAPHYCPNQIRWMRTEGVRVMVIAAEMIHITLCTSMLNYYSWCSLHHYNLQLPGFLSLPRARCITHCKQG